MNPDTNIIDLNQARQSRRDRRSALAPARASDIKRCCLYATLLKAGHEAEAARIDLDLHDRGIAKWWDPGDDLKARIAAHNEDWDLYRGLIQHIAGLLAETRAQAHLKRTTIGRLWLKPCTEGKWYDRLRRGCMADDHLFPPSLRLARRGA